MLDITSKNDIEKGKLEGSIKNIILDNMINELKHINWFSMYNKKEAIKKVLANILEEIEVLKLIK